MLRRTIKILAWGLVLGLSSSFNLQARALTLSQLETQTRILLRDTSSDTNFQRFSTTQIDAFLNEGQRDFQNQAWILQGTTSFLLVAGQRSYTMPSDFVAAVQVKISSTPIGEITVRGFTQNDPSFEVATGTPSVFFVDGYTNGTPPVMKFYPMPVSALTVTEYYVQQPATLVSSSDIPFNSNPELLTYHDALSDFAAAKCWLILGRVDLSTALMGMYSGRVQVARSDAMKQAANMGAK